MKIEYGGRERNTRMRMEEEREVRMRMEEDRQGEGGVGLLFINKLVFYKKKLITSQRL